MVNAEKRVSDFSSFLHTNRHKKCCTCFHRHLLVVYSLNTEVLVSQKRKLEAGKFETFQLGISK